ncbi:cysteine methyltransferase [candidate division MSBL1 archaeon SCGC-AAA382M17]|uniref:Cysteine methyltransferase n=1 Tax=candidate division MSBL1 archaeon SCGC-AAA382M17 TaxID=1698284 RepID=A0ABR5TLS5_9EURY|nr:cysteine methyltransferase [candidate division MSBL1 archaeon SCGC-AAA382M17]
MTEESFFQKVYQITKMIPEGRVTTYGAIARYLGAPGSARMVGWALNNAYSQDEFIPAHRVVNRNGCLTGKHHFHGPDVMQDLLESEGIQVKKDKIIDFQQHFWDPNKA